MTALLALAAKDIRLLLRNRGALFFTIGWPLLVAIFFGMVFGGDDARVPSVAIHRRSNCGWTRAARPSAR